MSAKTRSTAAIPRNLLGGTRGTYATTLTRFRYSDQLMASPSRDMIALPRSYWQASRAARYSLLFALPLLVFYQVLVALQSPGGEGGGTGQLRNGADVILESLFVWRAGRGGPLPRLACLTGFGRWLGVRDPRRQPGPLPGVFAGYLG